MVRIPYKGIGGYIPSFAPDFYAIQLLVLQFIIVERFDIIIGGISIIIYYYYW